MHQTVKVPCRLLDGLSHLIIAVEVEDIRNQIEGILVVLNLGVQASQVEPVREIFFIDFAEVLITAGRDELQQDELADSPPACF